MSVKYLKKGFKNIATYGISSAISRSITLILFPYFLNNITLEQLGIWDYYQSWFSLGTLLLGSSATIGFVRFYLLYLDDEETQKKTAGNSFLLGIVNSSFLGIILLIALNFQRDFCNKYAFSTACAMISFTFFSLTLTYARTKEYLTIYAFLSCAQSLFSSLFIIMGIYYGYGIDAFFWGTVASLTLFALPFFYLIHQYHTFSLSLLKEQLSYSIPLLGYSLLYASFFTIDRFILRYYGGYELLGSYAILWKFGSLFQFYAVALIDASPVIFYNAQKENNSDQLLSKCILYFIGALAIGSLICISCSFIIMDTIIPSAYRYIKEYICPFFFALFLLECARIIQCGIGLSMKTLYAPLNVALTLSLQYFFLMTFSSFKIWGIIGANIITFFLYSLLSYYTTAKLYSYAILNGRIISLLIALFLVSASCLHYIRNTTFVVQLCVTFLMTFAWFIIFLQYICDEHDKEFLKLYLTRLSVKISTLKIVQK